MSQIEENGATSGAGILVAYSYNNLGQRTGVSRAGGAGASTSYGYDGAWRLNSLAHTFASSANNQTIGLTSYSPAGQIFTRTSSNTAYNWTGSAALNRPYTSNGQNQLTASGTTALSYDTRGNLSSDSVNSYVYDAANNLTNYNSSATMTTDALGRLESVTDMSGGSPTTASRAFRYFGSAMIVEYGTVGATNGVIQARYVPGPVIDEPVVYYPGSSTTTKYWLLADERGSVIAQADGSGNLVSNTINTYDDYGQPATSNTGRFQYTGQAYIPETGLYHYKARDYSPMLGRFMQTDPIGYGDGMNWYAYAHNDPINGADPSGLGDPVTVDPTPSTLQGTQFPSITVYAQDDNNCEDCISFVNTGALSSAFDSQPAPNPTAFEAKAITQTAADVVVTARHPSHSYAISYSLTPPGTSCTDAQVSGAVNRNIVPGNYGNHVNNGNYRVVLLGGVYIGDITFRSNAAGTQFQNVTNLHHWLYYGSVTTNIKGNAQTGYTAYVVGVGSNTNSIIATANQWLGPAQFFVQLENASAELGTICGPSQQYGSAELF